MNAKLTLTFAALFACAGAFAQGASQNQPTAGKTRADVRAETAEARKSGELDRVREDYYGLPVHRIMTLGFAAAPSVGKTRAQVQAELAEARKSGELERLRQSYEGIQTPPSPKR
jgi:hypothetical protein